jgi:hypothetical protein
MPERPESGSETASGVSWRCEVLSRAAYVFAAMSGDGDAVMAARLTG